MAAPAGFEDDGSWWVRNPNVEPWSWSWLQDRGAWLLSGGWAAEAVSEVGEHAGDAVQGGAELVGTAAGGFVGGAVAGAAPGLQAAAKAAPLLLLAGAAALLFARR